MQDLPLSVEEFAALSEEEGYRLELSRGRVIREPAPGPRHGAAAGRLYRALWSFVEERGLGMVFFSTGFALAPEEGIVRVPDVAFLSSDRIPTEPLTDRFWELAPDLAIEVLSPSDRVSEMQQKILDYLSAGAGLVWIVDPTERRVTVYRSRSEIRILESGEVLDGGEVLPDLHIPVQMLFEV
jgi:Uma2 family endonuclease